MAVSSPALNAEAFGAKPPSGDLCPSLKWQRYLTVLPHVVYNLGLTTFRCGVVVKDG